METVAKRIENFFLLNGLEWRKQDGTMFVPTEEELQEALDRIAKVLDNEDEQTQMEFGRLIVKKRAGHIDVFILIGDLNESD